MPPDNLDRLIDTHHDLHIEIARLIQRVDTLIILSGMSVGLALLTFLVVLTKL